MSEEQLCLVLRCPASYVKGQGVGFGVPLRAECLATGCLRPRLIPSADGKCGVRREGLEFERIRSFEGAQMGAVVGALGLAPRTLKMHPGEARGVRKVRIYAHTQADSSEQSLFASERHAAG